MDSTASANQVIPDLGHDPFLGNTLAKRYLFMSILGSGGTGTVYLADDLLLKRKVAVKTILPSLADNPHIQERIERECRLHAAIGTHPHIVTLYDKLTRNGRIFLVMEYVQGEVLSDIPTDNGPPVSGQWPLDDAITLTMQILTAIDCIHAHGILHRDIKASNILVQKSKGQLSAKLMDFGIARMEENDDMLTRLTQINTSGPGTPTYMAPERIDPERFGKTCPATDLYSAGIILYQLLSGAPPFSGTISEIFNGHLNIPVDPDRLPQDISPQLRTVVSRALAKKTGDRFQSAEDFLHCLEKISAPHPLHPARQKSTDELTLPVIGDPATKKWEATLLAPRLEQAEQKVKSPVVSKVHLSVVVALAAIAIFFITFFLHHNSLQPTPASIHTEATQPSTKAQNRVMGAAPISTTNGPTISVPPRAMETLQAMRTGRTLDKNGLTIEKKSDTLGGQEDSDWQVLESSAQRIDKKHP